MPALQLPRILLLVSIFMSGFCGIIAELSLFNTGQALLGGTNRILTYTMGVMMFCMGLGSLSLRWAHFSRHLYLYFVLVEALLSLITASSVVALYFLSGFYPGATLMCVLLFSALIGYLIGFEIPLILLINEKRQTALKDSSSSVLFADYLGSLLAFVLFSHFLITSLGVARSAMVGGALNAGVALVTVYLIAPRGAVPGPIKGGLILCALGITALFKGEAPLLRKAEGLHFRDPVIYSRQTPYQKAVLTEGVRAAGPTQPWRQVHQGGKVILETVTARGDSLRLQKFTGLGGQRDLRFFLGGGLQFSTLDEFYYHETLVHPAFFLLDSQENPLRVLIGGGGDGLALREVLKYPETGRVDVVDLDPEITGLFSTNPELARLNDSAFHDARVYIYNEDIFTYLKQTQSQYHLILFDFPDPHQEEIAKLFSQQIYRYAEGALAPGGILVTQSTSPVFSRKAFLTIHNTLESIFPHQVVPLQIYMPTFGVWGFHLAAPGQAADSLKHRLDHFSSPVPVKYLGRETVQAALRFSQITWQGQATLPPHSILRPVLAQAYHHP